MLLSEMDPEKGGAREQGHLGRDAPMRERITTFA
jgi:hypothetical protein